MLVHIVVGTNERNTLVIDFSLGYGFFFFFFVMMGGFQSRATNGGRAYNSDHNCLKFFYLPYFNYYF